MELSEHFYPTITKNNQVNSLSLYSNKYIKKLQKQNFCKRVRPLIHQFMMGRDIFDSLQSESGWTDPF